MSQLDLLATGMGLSHPWGGKDLGMAVGRPGDPLDAGLQVLLLIGVMQAAYMALPLALDLARPDSSTERRWAALATGLAVASATAMGLAASVSTLLSHRLSGGGITGLFSATYATTVALIALAAQIPGRGDSAGSWLAELRALTLPHAVARAALLLWTVGAGWLLIDAFGLRPLGFAASIVRLTAIHFHYAAFIVPVIAAHVARAHPSSLGRAAAVVSVLGAPSTAIGITAVQRGAPLWLEALFALPMIGGALLVAAVHLRMAIGAQGQALSTTVRGLRLVVGICLLGTMLLAAAYAGRGSLFWSPTILQMALWHGVGNALGVAFCGLVACRLDRR